MTDCPTPRASSFTYPDSERAALALTEATTRLSDQGDAVPDSVWNEAARHYDERALAALVMQIALINAFNRINAATRQIAGAGMEMRGNGQRARTADADRAAAEGSAHR